MGAVDPAALPGILRAFLAEVPTLSLATVDEAGRPHAANVNFVADADLNLHFLSRADSAHARHVAARPDAAVTAYAPFRTAEEIRGVQMHGVCARVGDAAFEGLWRTYVAKHAIAAQFEAMAREQESWFRFTPRWVRWIDNGVRFGFKLASDWPVP